MSLGNIDLSKGNEPTFNDFLNQKFTIPPSIEVEAPTEFENLSSLVQDLIDGIMGSILGSLEESSLKLSEISKVSKNNLETVKENSFSEEKLNKKLVEIHTTHYDRITEIQEKRDRLIAGRTDKEKRRDKDLSAAKTAIDLDPNRGFFSKVLGKGMIDLRSSVADSLDFKIFGTSIADGIKPLGSLLDKIDPSTIQEKNQSRLDDINDEIKNLQLQQGLLGNEEKEQRAVDRLNELEKEKRDIAKSDPRIAKQDQALVVEQQLELIKEQESKTKEYEKSMNQSLKDGDDETALQLRRKANISDDKTFNLKKGLDVSGQTQIVSEKSMDEIEKVSIRLENLLEDREERGVDRDNEDHVFREEQIKILQEQLSQLKQNSKISQTAQQEKTAEKQEKEIEKKEERTWMERLFASLSGGESTLRSAKDGKGGSDGKSKSSFMWWNSGKGGKKGGLLNWLKNLVKSFGGIILNIFGFKVLFGKKGLIKNRSLRAMRVGLHKMLRKGILKSMGTLLKNLGLNLLKFIPRLAGFLVSGIIWAVTDAIEGMAEFGGISGLLGGLLGGLDKGVMGALKGAGKWALIGAGIGSIFGGPGIGTAIGGAIGAIFGAIIGFIGGEKISKILKDIGAWFGKKWDGVSDWFGKKWDGVSDWFGALGKDFSIGMDDVAKSLGFEKEFKKIKNFFNWENFKRDLGVVWKEIKMAFTGVWKSVATWFGTKWETFKKDLDLVWQDIKNAVTGVFSTEGTIGKWWAELKKDLGVVWEDIKQNKLVKGITDFFGWFAKLFSWENIKEMMKKMAKGAGVPDMVVKWIESGFARKAEPPKTTQESLGEATKSGFFKEGGFFSNDSVDIKKVDKASTEQIKAVLSEGDLSDEDRRMLESVLSVRNRKRIQESTSGIISSASKALGRVQNVSDEIQASEKASSSKKSGDSVAVVGSNNISETNYQQIITGGGKRKPFDNNPQISYNEYR